MRPNPLQIHQLISQSRPPKAEHHYWLSTDGSGHTDGLGGAAAVLMAPCQRNYQPQYRWMGALGTSVNRMEFEALLMGLQMVEEMQRLPSAVHCKPLVWWNTDRENLALSVWRQPDPDNPGQPAQPFYRRKTEPDLWARFAYYEERMIITPVWGPRNTISLQKETDELAGFGRQCAKQALQRVLTLLGVQ